MIIDCCASRNGLAAVLSQYADVTELQIKLTTNRALTKQTKVMKYFRQKTTFDGYYYNSPDMHHAVLKVVT